MSNRDNLNRLNSLSTFGLSLLEKKKKLKPYVALAQSMTDSPVCEINIIDAHYQWTIAGADKVMLKEESICKDTIQKKETFEVSNLTTHRKYKDRSYVNGKPWFKYYCGVPLITSENHAIGSICVLDMEPKTMTDKQKKGLESLADVIVDKLEDNKELFEAKSKIDELKSKFREFNHDIRSPINGIVGIADLLAKESPSEQLQMIRECAETVIEKVDEVLTDINVVDVGKPQQSKNQLEHIFKRVKRLYRPRVQYKNITLQFDIDNVRELLLSREQAQKIAQIAGNLIANSIKFTNRGGQVSVDVYKEEKDSSHQLIILIEDDGQGMSPEQVAAFNDGEVVSRTIGTDGEPSFGMGLKHVKELVATLNGAIEVSSTKGEGTCFSISLPI